MRKICVITTNRAEYGLLYWLMKGIQADPFFQLQVVVTGAHLSPEFGSTIDRIREDSERDRFFDAKQSVAYGICDEILGEDAGDKAAAAADATKPK